MCGRYQLPEEPNALLSQVLDQLNRGPVKRSGEVFPSEVVPVLARSRAGRPRGFAMRWGYSLNGKRVINARSETARERPMFRDGAAHRRCLIPLSGYYEWHRAGDGQKHFVVPDEPAWLAGLYRLTDAEPEFAVLTRAPVPGIAWLHDRMPVLLPEAAWEEWLDIDGDWEKVLAQAVGARVIRNAEFGIRN